MKKYVGSFGKSAFTQSKNNFKSFLLTYHQKVVLKKCSQQKNFQILKCIKTRFCGKCDRSLKKRIFKIFAFLFFSSDAPKLGSSLDIFYSIFFFYSTLALSQGCGGCVFDRVSKSHLLKVANEDQTTFFI